MYLEPEEQEPKPLGCLCIKCCNERLFKSPSDDDLHFAIGRTFENFRYACEICGNKRCPHHSNHELACTGSNELGQPGSVYR